MTTKTNLNEPVSERVKIRLLDFINQLTTIIPDVIEQALPGKEGAEKRIGKKIVDLIKDKLTGIDDLKYLYAWMGIPEFWDKEVYSEIFTSTEMMRYYEIHDGGITIVNHLVHGLIELESTLSVEDIYKFLDKKKENKQ